jgi:ERCC4-type nuclease
VSQTEIYCLDSREKKNEHIKAYFDRHDIPYIVKKLDVGDYMIDGGTISVDRKRSLDELSTNLTNPQDKKRFMREVRRAREAGIQLVVLCEHGGKIKCLQDVAGWRSEFSPVTGRALLDRMYKLSVSYGVRFEFCSKRSTGKRIVEILEGK